MSYTLYSFPGPLLLRFSKTLSKNIPIQFQSKHLYKTYLWDYLFDFRVSSPFIAIKNYCSRNHCGNIYVKTNNLAAAKSRYNVSRQMCT